MKFNVFVKGKNLSKICYEHKNLMDSLGVYGGFAPKGCHNGACGVCKISIIKGEFKLDKMNRKYISKEEEAKNIFLACKVFPRSDMEIEFIKKQKPKHYCFGDNTK